MIEGVELLKLRPGLEKHGEAIGWKGQGINDDGFIGVDRSPREARDQVVEDDEEVHARKLVPGAHPRAAAERDERERGRARALEPRRIELVGIWEVVRVSMRRVRRPHHLDRIGEATMTTMMQMMIMMTMITMITIIVRPLVSEFRVFRV
jgi:hypothetical protein